MEVLHDKQEMVMQSEGLVMQSEADNAEELHLQAQSQEDECDQEKEMCADHFPSPQQCYI